MSEFRITTSWPPSVNHYWLTSGKHKYISIKGVQYITEVKMTVKQSDHIPLTGRLAVVIQAFPPDHRKRDIDNIIKCTLDSLERASVYCNDNQVDQLSISRCAVEKPGRLEIFVCEI